ncbi:iron chelate uptake ABC transporter family permease subunit [Frigidibacter sp.]|uniref:iron chelate uptake ABC transporter family permease subunit n=1 Tax=Frigidibacter sp. TaxID=2586418 RepID=UPI0027342BA1|nr:iron chelate uptake ABC transporter family permease subunit [Frigidibacter sp.]MDP3339320.1 iron chelate uptake ABC transporter family permease subunit [Frigidibacter sp.]
MRTVFRSALLPPAALIAAVVALTIWTLTVPGAAQDGLPDSFVRAWRAHALVPRVWVALLAGAALGLSALIFQQVLRNPLAEPGTLGVLSGAQLAITLASLGTVTLDPALREAVGLGGGLLALAAVVLLAGVRASGPVLLVAGLVVNLVIGSVFVVLALLRHEYLRSVFVWASGNLSQNGPDDAIALALRLAVLGPVLLLALRALVLFTLSDESIRGLGANVGRLRLAALVLATLLAAMVTARVGVIGFIGLAAPMIAQGLGIRTLQGRALAAPAVGAALLLAADGTAQALGRLLGEHVALIFPTGILTPVLGGAILLGLLWQRRIADRPVQPLAAPSRRPTLATALAIAVLIAAIALSLTETLHLPALAASELWGGRWPRVLTAASAGLMLALAGVVMQAVTGNPLASPESLGISSGAGLGIIAGLFAGGAAAMLAGAVAGALVAFAVVIVLAARNRFAPGPMLLAGVALGTFAGAMISLMIASGGDG